MSKKYLIIFVIGLLGVGIMMIKNIFDQIFCCEGIQVVSIEGDVFYCFDRVVMKVELVCCMDVGDNIFSYFSIEVNELFWLEQVFCSYGEIGIGQICYYVYDDREVVVYGSVFGMFMDWVELLCLDLLFYEGLYGVVKIDGIDIVGQVDLKIGVVLVINLEWIQKIYCDKVSCGYLIEVVIDVILCWMYVYVYVICLQFIQIDINFQCVFVVDILNLFIVCWIFMLDESFVVICFKNLCGIDFFYLIQMIQGLWMSCVNFIVIFGLCMDLVMQLILMLMILCMVSDVKCV